MRDRGETHSLKRRGDFYWIIDASGARTLALAIPVATPNPARPWMDSDWDYSQWTIDHPNHCGAQWSWDGNESKPTLSPSLHAVGEWHGWVQGGTLVEA